jgi:phosphoribosylcarboxyaminoimidazole (NCAIR) mutase
VSSEESLALVAVVVIVAGITIWLIIRKLSRTRVLATATRLTAVRAEVRADSAERTANRMADLAENAQAIAGKILTVDGKADDMNAKLDVIVSAVTGQPAVAVRPGGRHARPPANLHVVHDDQRRPA